MLDRLKQRLRPIYMPLIGPPPSLLHLLTGRNAHREAGYVREFHDVTWGRYRDWLGSARSLDEWLCIPGHDDRETVGQIDGKVVSHSFDWLAFRAGLIGDAIERHFPEATSVTEYGCGIGRNLLHLWRRFPKLELYGYELSPAGVEIAQAAAAKFQAPVRFAQLDYLRSPSEAFVFPTTDLAFTVSSLEQLPHTALVALKNMLDRSRLGSLHLEPVAENYPLTYRGLLGRLYTRRADYVRNFDAGVRGLPIKVVHREVTTTAHNPLIFPTLYVLRK